MLQCFQHVTSAVSRDYCISKHYFNVYRHLQAFHYTNVRRLGLSRISLMCTGTSSWHWGTGAEHISRCSLRPSQPPTPPPPPAVAPPPSQPAKSQPSQSQANPQDSLTSVAARNNAQVLKPKLSPPTMCPQQPHPPLQQPERTPNTDTFQQQPQQPGAGQAVQMFTPSSIAPPPRLTKEGLSPFAQAFMPMTPVTPAQLHASVTPPVGLFTPTNSPTAQTSTSMTPPEHLGYPGQPFRPAGKLMLGPREGLGSPKTAASPEYLGYPKQSIRPAGKLTSGAREGPGSPRIAAMHYSADANRVHVPGATSVPASITETGTLFTQIQLCTTMRQPHWSLQFCT